MHEGWYPVYAQSKSCPSECWWCPRVMATGEAALREFSTALDASLGSWAWHAPAFRGPLRTASAGRLLECGRSLPVSFPTLGSVELPKANPPQGLTFVISSQHSIQFQ